MQRTLLRILVGSVALNAALGVYALVAAEFGDMQQNVLFTSLCLSAAGLLALACGPAAERSRLRPLPQLGTLAAAVGFGLLVVAIWLESPPEPLWKTAGTLIVAAVAAAYGSLLALARLAPRFRWAFGPAVGLSVVLAGLAVSLVWGQWDSEWFARALGVVAVLLAAFTVLVPILRRASRELPAAHPPRAAAPVRFCPACGRPVTSDAGTETRCPHCGARFTVSFRGSRAA